MWSFWLCYVRINKLPPRSRICPAAFEGGNAMPAHSNMTQGCFQRTWTEQSCYSGGRAVFPLATLKSLLIAGSDKWWGFWIGRCKHRSVSISGRRSVSISGRLSPFYLSPQGSPTHRLDNHSSFLTSVQEPRWGEERQASICSLMVMGQDSTEAKEQAHSTCLRSISILSAYHLHLRVSVVMFTNRQVIGSWCLSMNW